MWPAILQLFGQATQNQAIPAYSYAPPKDDYTMLYAVAGLGAVGLVAYLLLKD